MPPETSPAVWRSTTQAAPLFAAPPLAAAATGVAPLVPALARRRCTLMAWETVATPRASVDARLFGEAGAVREAAARASELVAAVAEHQAVFAAQLAAR